MINNNELQHIRLNSLYKNNSDLLHLPRFLHNTMWNNIRKKMSRYPEIDESNIIDSIQGGILKLNKKYNIYDVMALFRNYDRVNRFIKYYTNLLSSDYMSPKHIELLRSFRDFEAQLLQFDYIDLVYPDSINFNDDNINNTSNDANVTADNIKKLYKLNDFLYLDIRLNKSLHIWMYNLNCFLFGLFNPYKNYKYYKLDLIKSELHTVRNILQQEKYELKSALI